MLKKVITEEELEIYEYGFELLLTSAVNVLLVVIAAFIIGPLWGVPLVLIPFALIRRTSGGYHAKTHLGCAICLLVVYICGVTTVKHIPADMLCMCSQAALVLSVVIVLLIGNIAHENRPVNREEAVKFRKQSVFTVAVLCAAGMIGNYIAPCVFAYFTLGVFIAAASLLAAWIINTLKKGDKF